MLQDFLIKNSQINYEYSQKCYFILLFIIHFWKIHHKWILRALMPFTPINAKNLNFQKRLANISRKTSNNNKFSKICIIFVEKILQTHFKNCLKLYFLIFWKFLKPPSPRGSVPPDHLRATPNSETWSPEKIPAGTIAHVSKNMHKLGEKRYYLKA